MTYPVLQVSTNASTQLEQLGTKGKFWYWTEDNQRMLFKEGRPGTGENWAEKVCCEIARMLSLPHAEYDLAVCDGKQGVTSLSVVPDQGSLIHGNELLSTVFEDEDYDPTATYRDSQHTLRRVVDVLRSPLVARPMGWPCPPEVGNAVGVFSGYLLLDTLVGNQDRHHENWALIHTAGSGLSLAPTFDHASSLGRNETDAIRTERLTTKDAGRSVAHYATRARSALYETPSSRSPMSTLEAFSKAIKITPEAGGYWLRRLEGIEAAMFEGVLTQIPSDWITPPAIRFASAMLTINRDRLLKLKNTL